MAKRLRKAAPWEESPVSPANCLDDGCLMHIFSFLSPIPDRYNTALVCHRWRYLACHPRLWLRVERPLRNVTEPGVYMNLEAAVSAARPGDTILIGAGSTYLACNIQIKKPLCIIGGGELPDDTVLTCSRGSDKYASFFCCNISPCFLLFCRFTMLLQSLCVVIIALHIYGFSPANSEISPFITLN
uniref:Uncharacterized protein n=1 Tax=Avena sativa TaxID=4498 RepID=A0ACD5WPM4_AVESA